MNNTDLKFVQAHNKAIISALESYDIKVFGDFLKKWDSKGYKRYKCFTDKEKKRVLCRIIIKNKDNLNNEMLYNRAKKWLDDHILEGK